MKTAHSAGFSEFRLFTGDRELTIASVDVALAGSSATTWGFGGATWSERRLNRQVQSLRANVSRSFSDTTVGLRSFYYPRLSSSQSYGGGLFFQRRTEDSGSEYEGSWGLSASWIQQEMRSHPRNPPKRIKRFGEGVLEFNSRQSYFSQFNFQITGSYFAYDRELGDVSLFKTTFLQSDVATLGTFSAVTEPPEWAGAVQFSRAFDDDEWNSMLLGYSRIGLAEGGRHLNSYLIGVQFKAGDPIGVRLGYNGVNGKGVNWSDYYGATVAYYWR